MRVFLEFAPSQSGVQRARLTYAFRLFCAVYGHQPLTNNSESASADLFITYDGCSSKSAGRPTLLLENDYICRPLHKPAPTPRKVERDGEEQVLAYSLSGREPDWFGEIFEWVSCNDEYSVPRRDSVGRVPFQYSLVGRHGLNPCVPYAARLMRGLQRSIIRLVPGQQLQPRSPSPPSQHFVVNTHDVDYLPSSRSASAAKLLRNAIVSCIRHRRPGVGFAQAAEAICLILSGRNALDQILALTKQARDRRIVASYYFLAARRHRRDANYTLDDEKVRSLLSYLQLLGMEIGVHGSYASLDKPNQLRSEFDSFRALGFSVLGGRQHWLRFTLESLIPECQQAGAAYDASLGWSEQVGFRAGACFAFPPWDFRLEKPAGFLEIPLAAMDVSLLNSGMPEELWFAKVAEVLRQSRQYGWGGISVIWHNTSFGGGQYPLSVGKVYWDLIDRKSEWQDTWTSARDFLAVAWRRYFEVGLLPAEAPPSALQVHPTPGVIPHSERAAVSKGMIRIGAPSIYTICKKRSPIS
jgi:hypothetical protein